MAEWQNWALLGQAIRARRTALRLSQPKLAKKAQVSLSTINLLENAKQTSYQSVTIGAVERALDWAPGSFQSVLAHRDESRDKLDVAALSENLATRPKTQEISEPASYGDEIV